DRSGNTLRTNNQVDILMRQIGKYQEDLGVYLGTAENCAKGLSALLGRLDEAQYRLCAWRLTQ
ncbi:MAG: hypothetical protein IKM11_06060, partial [Oscillospiraceae bacterium]|nr:hypothetical protein [Oscillospiraceae bacterium]